MYKLPSGFIFCKIGAGSVSFPLPHTFKTGWISTTLLLSTHVNVCCKLNFTFIRAWTCTLTQRCSPVSTALFTVFLLFNISTGVNEIYARFLSIVIKSVFGKVLKVERVSTVFFTTTFRERNV